MTYRLTANRALPLLALPAGRGALFPGGHFQVDRTLGCPECGQVAGAQLGEG